MVKLIKDSYDRIVLLHSQKKFTREEALEYFKGYGEEQPTELKGWQAVNIKNPFEEDEDDTEEKTKFTNLFDFIG